MYRLYGTLALSAGLGWRHAPSGGPRIGSFHWLLCFAIFLSSCQPSPTPPRPDDPQPPPASPLIYFPIIAQPPTDPVATCLDTNPQALAFYRSLVGDSRQERTRLDCHPALVRAAQRRAASLVASGLWSHCDPNGVCANQVARNMGCTLPATYGAGNNIESLVAGSPDAGVMFAALANSPGHSPHLFGRGWFRHQRHVGIAYVAAPGSRFGFYWVVLIGVCEGG